MTSSETPGLVGESETDVVDVGSGDLSFTCPRCGSAAEAEYYGPCPSCCQELRSAYEGLGRDVVAEAYEPKMNVTPNAVASKE